MDEEETEPDTELQAALARARRLRQAELAEEASFKVPKVGRTTLSTSNLKSTMKRSPIPPSVKSALHVNITIHRPMVNQEEWIMILAAKYCFYIVQLFINFGKVYRKSLIIYAMLL